MKSPRTSILLDPGDLGASPGSEKWALAVRLEIQSKIKDLRDTENHLKTWRDGFRRYEGWRVLKTRDGRLFDSWEEFCKYPKPFGLEISPEELDLEVEHRELRKHGANRYTMKGESRVDNVKSKGGNQSSYILARLERDGKTELLERIKSGELSAHAAAIEAGFRRHYIQVCPTVKGFIAVIRKHLSADEIESLKAAI